MVLGCSSSHDANWQVETDATPSAAHPYGGFWKTDASDQWGLAIGPSGDTEYYVSFCGPGGCFGKGDYRPITPLVGDPSYRIVDINTIEIQTKDGFTTYYRSGGRTGSGFAKGNAEQGGGGQPATRSESK